jgi:hypothetical protein
VLFGPLPLEPTAAFAQAMALMRTQQQHQHQQLQQQEQLQQAAKRLRAAAARFGQAELERRPTDALRGLYAERPFRWPEDGVRFKSQLELNAYIDVFAEKRRAALRVEQSGAIQRREWYCNLREWVSNSAAGRGAEEGAEGPAGGAGPGGKGKSGPGAGSAAAAKVFIVPADEHFTRCPVSKETFETVWNDEEGEFMYKHAVKVLVTAAADGAVFKLAQATGHAGVRYIVAHKRLVVDEWVEAGKAASLRDASLRYEALGGARAADVRALKQAAGEGEEDAVFVMMDLSR